MSTVFDAQETVDWFRRTMEAQLVKALAHDRRTDGVTARRAAHAAQQERVAPQIAAARAAYVAAHPNRIKATPTIEVEDWFSDAPLAYGESNIPTTVVPDFENDEQTEPYEIETWQVLDDVATVAWLKRDAASYRVAWSEQDERRYVLGRLRWQVQMLARKHRTTSRVAVAKYPAARAAMQQALALKARWDFQHELARAGAEPTKEVTGWCKAAFGRTFGVALDEIRSARKESQRQAFRPVRAGMV